MRRALVVGCAMVLIGSVTAVAPADPVEVDKASALHATPWAAAEAEARVLADRILARESDALLLDGKRQRALGYEIKRTLSLVRRSHPPMAKISVREEHRPATLLLGLEGALHDAVVGTWGDNSASAPPRTGRAGFDDLNTRLGLRSVQPFPALGAVSLTLDERVNVEAAVRAYRVIDGVTYVEPDAALGDGPDIDAAKVQGTWHVVFRDAWGDCPAGCIHSELSFFTVAEGEVQRIEPAEARVMDPFATLIADRGWR